MTGPNNTDLSQEKMSEPWSFDSEDMHLRIWLGDMAFDYIASSVVVANLISDWHRRPWYAIELIRIGYDNPQLPRLPCARLFQGP